MNRNADIWRALNFELQILDDTAKCLSTYIHHTIQTTYTPHSVAIEQLLKSAKACWYIRFLNVMAKNHIEKILPFVIYTMFNSIRTPT